MDQIPQTVDDIGEMETTLVATSVVANSQEQEAEDMRDMRKVLHHILLRILWKLTMMTTLIPAKH
jgi:hypothetical protein